MAGIVLAVGGCAESQEPEPDVQATIDASVEATVAASRRVATPTPSINDSRKASAAAEEIASIVATATTRLHLSAEPTPTAISDALTAKEIQRIVAESSREAKSAAEEIASIVATATTESQLAAEPTPTAATNALTAKDIQRIIATAVADATQPTVTPLPSGLTAQDIQRIVAAASDQVLTDSHPTTLSEVYEAPSARWSIRHPEGWIAYEANVAYSERIQLAGLVESSHGSAPVAVIVERVPDGGLLPLAESTDAVILLNLGHLDDFRLISRSAQTLGATNAEEIVFTHKAPLIGPAIGLMIVVRAASDMYTIQGVTLSSSFEHVEGGIRDIVYSFRTLSAYSRP